MKILNRHHWNFPWDGRDHGGYDVNEQLVGLRLREIGLELCQSAKNLWECEHRVLGWRAVTIWDILVRVLIYVREDTLFTELV